MGSGIGFFFQSFEDYAVNLLETILSHSHVNYFLVRIDTGLSLFSRTDRVFLTSAHGKRAIEVAFAEQSIGNCNLQFGSVLITNHQSVIIVYRIETFKAVRICQKHQYIVLVKRLNFLNGLQFCLTKPVIVFLCLIYSSPKKSDDDVCIVCLIENAVCCGIIGFVANAIAVYLLESPAYRIEMVERFVVKSNHRNMVAL